MRLNCKQLSQPCVLEIPAIDLHSKQRQFKTVESLSCHIFGVSCSIQGKYLNFRNNTFVWPVRINISNKDKAFGLHQVFKWKSILNFFVSSLPCPLKDIMGSHRELLSLFTMKKAFSKNNPKQISDILVSLYLGDRCEQFPLILTKILVSKEGHVLSRFSVIFRLCYSLFFLAVWFI